MKTKKKRINVKYVKKEELIYFAEKNVNFYVNMIKVKIIII